jgi:hypothetical protein
MLFGILLLYFCQAPLPVALQTFLLLLLGFALIFTLHYECSDFVHNSRCCRQMMNNFVPQAVPQHTDNCRLLAWLAQHVQEIWLTLSSKMVICRSRLSLIAVFSCSASLIRICASLASVWAISDNCFSLTDI